jgi:hypothetical protein
MAEPNANQNADQPNDANMADLMLGSGDEGLDDFDGMFGELGASPEPPDTEARKGTDPEPPDDSSAPSEPEAEQAHEPRVSPEQPGEQGQAPEGADSSAEDQLDQLQAAVAAAIEDAAAEAQIEAEQQQATPEEPADGDQAPNPELGDEADPQPEAEQHSAEQEAQREPRPNPQPDHQAEPQADKAADEAMAAAAASLEPERDEGNAEDSASPDWAAPIDPADTFDPEGDEPPDPRTAEAERVEVPVSGGSDEPVGPSEGGKAASPPSRLRPALVLPARLATGAAEALAGPLERAEARFAAAPTAVRQSLAWVALWTLFNAGVVWGYLALFRSGTPEAGAGGSVLISGEPGAPPAPAVSEGEGGR